MTLDDPHIQKAIEAVGSQHKLAEVSGLSQQYISKLLKRTRRPSAAAAIAISRATLGQVRISDLLPEIVSAVASELAERGAAA